MKVTCLTCLCLSLSLSSPSPFGWIEVVCSSIPYQSDGTRGSADPCLALASWRSLFRSDSSSKVSSPFYSFHSCLTRDSLLRILSKIVAWSSSCRTVSSLFSSLRYFPHFHETQMRPYSSFSFPVYLDRQACHHLLA